MFLKPRSAITAQFSGSSFKYWLSSMIAASDVLPQKPSDTKFIVPSGDIDIKYFNVLHFLYSDVTL